MAGAKARRAMGALAIALGMAAGQSITTLSFTDPLPASANIPPAEWKDYKVDMDSDEANLVFQVNATSDYANAIGIYVSEDLPTVGDRLQQPGQFLDFDATSMIEIDGVRQYSVVLAQCFVQKKKTYYLSVFGKNVAGKVSSKPTVPITVRALKVPSRIPINATITGQVCDGHYMHYFWEIDSSFASGGVRTSVNKLEGELDAAYMRYERCAGLAGSNIASVPLEGHGSPGGSIVLPMGATPLEAGRYYVSVKAKPEICGDFSITASQLSQVALLASPASSLRSRPLLSLLASLVPAWLLGRVVR